MTLKMAETRIDEIHQRRDENRNDTSEERAPSETLQMEEEYVMTEQSEIETTVTDKYQQKALMMEQRVEETCFRQMTTATAKFIERHLTCPICHDEFQDPRRLSCQHVLCLRCLQGHINVNAGDRLIRRRNEWVKGFNCPECRKMIRIPRPWELSKERWATQIPSDFKTAGILDGIKAILSIQRHWESSKESLANQVTADLKISELQADLRGGECILLETAIPGINNVCPMTNGEDGGNYPPEERASSDKMQKPKITEQNELEFECTEQTDNDSTTMTVHNNREAEGKEQCQAGSIMPEQSESEREAANTEQYQTEAIMTEETERETNGTEQYRAQAMMIEQHKRETSHKDQYQTAALMTEEKERYVESIIQYQTVVEITETMEREGGSTEQHQTKAMMREQTVRETESAEQYRSEAMITEQKKREGERTEQYQMEDEVTEENEIGTEGTGTCLEYAVTTEQNKRGASITEQCQAEAMITERNERATKCTEQGQAQAMITERNESAEHHQTEVIVTGKNVWEAKRTEQCHAEAMMIEQHERDTTNTEQFKTIAVMTEKESDCDSIEQYQTEAAMTGRTEKEVIVKDEYQTKVLLTEKNRKSCADGTVSDAIMTLHNKRESGITNQYQKEVIMTKQSKREDAATEENQWKSVASKQYQTRDVQAESTGQCQTKVIKKTKVIQHRNRWMKRSECPKCRTTIHIARPWKSSVVKWLNLIITDFKTVNTRGGTMEGKNFLAESNESEQRFHKTYPKSRSQHVQTEVTGDEGSSRHEQRKRTSQHIMEQGQTPVQLKPKSMMNSKFVRVISPLDHDTEFFDLIVLVQGQSRIIVLIDLHKNEIITLTLNEEMKYVETKNLGLGCKPWRICKLTNTQVAVSVSETNGVLICTIGTDITIDRLIPFKKDYDGIAMISPGIFVLTTKDNVDIAKDNGRVLKEFKISDPQAAYTDNSYVACTANENMVVTDFYGQTVSCVSPAGKVIWKQKMSALGVACDDDGSIYVVDYKTEAVDVFNRRGQFVSRVVEKSDSFYKPSGIDIDGTGYMYVICNFKDITIWQMSSYEDENNY